MERSSSIPLTRLVARGTIINGTAALLAGVLFAGRNLIAASFMEPVVLAVWTVTGMVLVTAVSLRGIGVVEKFVVDRERPPREAFSDAFVIGLAFSTVVGVVIAALTPLLVLLYDDTRLWGPLLVVGALVIVDGLKFPIWWHYRELRYGRLRTLTLIDAAGSVLFALPLLALGWDYWALLAGASLASVVTIVLAWGLGPRPKWVWPSREIVSGYVAFGAPVVGFALLGIVLGHLGALTLRHAVGLYVLGWFGVAVIPFLASERITVVLNQSVYPALVRRGAATRERAVEIMQRIAWAVPTPFLLGVVATAPFLIPLGLGTAWETAGAMMSVIALGAVIRNFGFPFAVVVMSTGETSAIKTYAWVFGLCGVFLVIPLIIIWGLVGWAIGILATELICAAVRWRIVQDKLPGVDLFRDTFDDLMIAALPALGAGGVLLATQGFSWWFRLGLALFFGTLGLVMVALRHRPLMRQVVAAVRAPAPPPVEAEPPPLPRAATAEEATLA